MKLDSARLIPKSAGYSIASSNGVLDATLLSIASEYRTDISRKYITLPLRELGPKFASGTNKVLVSTKEDGEAVFVYFDLTEEIKIFAYNAPSGRVRVGLPCLTAALEQLQAAGHKKGLLVGELFLRAEKRTSVGDVITASFRGNEKDLESLSVAFYDIVMLDGVDWRKSASDFTKVWDKLGIFKAPNARRVDGEIVPETSVRAAFDRVVSLGLEGVVVRRLNKAELYKVKPMCTVDAVVIGFVESAFEDKYGVSSLLVGLTSPGNVIREFARVGSGFSDDQRIKLLAELTKDKVTAPISKTDSDGRPISFVKPRLIVQVEGEALESSSFSGRDNLSQTFTYAGEKFRFRGLHRFPRLTHATFACFREDKSLDDGGARSNQVVSEKEEAEFTYEDTVAGVTQILHRDVYAKTTKGETAVRKFLLLETDGAQRFPYVITFIELSLTRKDPWAIEQRVATDIVRAKELYSDMMKENLAKGWELQKPIVEAVAIQL